MRLEILFLLFLLNFAFVWLLVFEELIKMLKLIVI